MNSKRAVKNSSSSRTIALLCLLGLLAGRDNAFGFHDWRDKVRCLDCHVTLPLQIKEIKELRFHPSILGICLSCHPRAHEQATPSTSHPLVAKTPLSFPRDMPKDDAGRMNCMTCHYYHPSNTGASNTRLLRRPADRNFCLYCHHTLPLP